MTSTLPLSLGQTIAPEVLKRDFLKLEEMPYDKPEFAYSLVLPQTWTQAKLPPIDGGLRFDQPTMLSTFVGPADANDDCSMLQVWCQGLRREISASDWLKNFLSSGNSSILDWEVRSPYLADARVQRQEGNVVLILRLSARVVGNRLFLVQCLASDNSFRDSENIFGLAIASFKVSQRPDNPHVELWQTHRLDDALTFHAPLSWVERRPETPVGLDFVELFSLNRSGQPVGILKAMSLRKKLTTGKNGLDLPALLASEFAKGGLQLVELAAAESIPLDEPFSKGFHKVWKATFPTAQIKRELNLLVLSMETATHHFLVGLQTCAPGQDFYEYAVHRRAFDIVLETLGC